MPEVRPRGSGYGAIKPVGSLCEVRVRDLEVMADIGVMAHEVGIPQKLRVAVSIWTALPGGDTLDETFDYRSVRTIAMELAASRILLIETFARRLAQRCLAVPRVMRVEVDIDKPQAMVGCVAGTRVVMARVDSGGSRS